MKVATLLGLMLALSIGTGASAVGDDIMKQLVPTGKLRVGVAYAPASTPIFVAKDAVGDVHGVPLDLGIALSSKLKKRTALVRALKEVFRRHRSQPIERVISLINPVLRGWVNPVSHHSHLPHPPGYLPA
jgi:hypothetical protein